MRSVTAAFSAAIIAASVLTPSFAFANTCYSGKASTISTSQRLTADAIATARTANIIPVSACEYTDVVVALASKGAAGLQLEIRANRALLADLQAQGFTTADIIGAVRNGPVTIYVRSRNTGQMLTLPFSRRK
ncbi:MAG TPA: hypothetical protein VL418_03080 [Devosiaceae bacterium]|jgi:hypothetical protein|nr:hypothetical protein [Devosiaceae bacterium]